MDELDMRRNWMVLILFLVIFILAAMLNACLAAPTPLPPLPTNTPLQPTETPTTTPVWFPPTATNTPLPSLVVTPTQDLAPQFGDLILNDPFTDPTIWVLGKSRTGSVALGKNELTIAVSQPGGYLYSIRQKTILADFYAEITASPSLCRGNDEYGLLVHFNSPTDFFRFSLTCNGQVRVDRLLRNQASSPQPLIYSGAVPPGAPSTSRLGVSAQGKLMRFYANGQYLFSVSDPSLLTGSLGVFARSAGDNVVTVNYSDLSIYQARK
jgi:hypothetical protein